MVTPKKIKPTPTLTDKDWERIELYLKAGSKPWKIASIFNLSNSQFKTLLENKYGDTWESYIESFDAQGISLIEAKQFQKAMDGNITMLIWLGKVRCGQKEPDNNVTIPPAQEQIDKDHIIMQLQHENRGLLEKLGEQKLIGLDGNQS